jgi:hypothetical protein
MSERKLWIIACGLWLVIGIAFGALVLGGNKGEGTSISDLGVQVESMANIATGVLAIAQSQRELEERTDIAIAGIQANNAAEGRELVRLRGLISESAIRDRAIVAILEGEGFDFTGLAVRADDIEREIAEILEGPIYSPDEPTD